jgi:hypothetical protein
LLLFAQASFGCLTSDTIGSGGADGGGEAPWYPPIAGNSEGGGLTLDYPGGASVGGSPSGGEAAAGGAAEGGAPPGVVCGDDSCDPSEDCDLCSEDCGVCACSPDALEPNAGSGTASPTTLGVDYCDLSVCTSDFDWFEFTVGTSFTATLTFLQAEGDLELEIYSEATGNYVTGSYSAADGESVTLTGLAPGSSYWARVYGDGGDENPDYCIRVD